MTKGLFIINSPSVIEKNTGISNKIKTQIELLSKYDLNCQMYVLSDGVHDISLNLRRLHMISPWGNIFPQWHYSDEITNSDYIYLRRPQIIKRPMIRFFKLAKKNNPLIKVILEIPTYPYDQEQRRKWFKWLDQYYRRKLYGLVDLITYIGNPVPSGKLWRIRAIQLYNGISVKAVKVIEPKPHNGINILCISSCEFWHGYERLLYGVTDYLSMSNNPKEFHVNIVGDGPYLNLYKKIVSDNSIEKYVKFLGELKGEELDALYDSIDISIGTLGCHRKNLTVSSELKSRESFAKGIPFAGSCDIDIFMAHPTEYFLKLQEGESPVQIESIINFTETIYSSSSRKQVISNIRNYAVKYMDYERVFEPVISFIKNR